MTTAEGMQFDRGYASAYMVTDTDKMEAVLDNPLILITDKKISNIQELLPLLEQVVQAGKKLLIIAEDVEGEALSDLGAEQAARYLHLRGRQGSRLWRSAVRKCCSDIAILTGGQVITEELGLELKDRDP